MAVPFSLPGGVGIIARERGSEKMYLGGRVIFSVLPSPPDNKKWNSLNE